VLERKEERGKKGLPCLGTDIAVWFGGRCNETPLTNAREGKEDSQFPQIQIHYTTTLMQGDKTPLKTRV
jgi:hypothetical protein